MPDHLAPMICTAINPQQTVTVLAYRREVRTSFNHDKRCVHQPSCGMSRALIQLTHEVSVPQCDVPHVPACERRFGCDMIVQSGVRYWTVTTYEECILQIVIISKQHSAQDPYIRRSHIATLRSFREIPTDYADWCLLRAVLIVDVGHTNAVTEIESVSGVPVLKITRTDHDLIGRLEATSVRFAICAAWTRIAHDELQNLSIFSSSDRALIDVLLHPERLAGICTRTRSARSELSDSKMLALSPLKSWIRWVAALEVSSGVGIACTEAERVVEVGISMRTFRRDQRELRDRLKVVPKRTAPRTVIDAWKKWLRDALS